MPLLKPNIFTNYELTEEEEQDATLLSPLQLCKIHNLLSDAADRRVKLKYDPANPQVFIQDDAYLKGIVETLEGLITESEEVRQLKIQKLAEQTQSRQQPS